MKIEDKRNTNKEKKKRNKGFPYKSRIKKEKCLVTEAMEKCQCEMCKLGKEAGQFAFESYVKLEAQRIYLDALKEEKIILK